MTIIAHNFNQGWKKWRRTTVPPLKNWQGVFFHNNMQPSVFFFVSFLYYWLVDFGIQVRGQFSPKNVCVARIVWKKKGVQSQGFTVLKTHPRLHFVGSCTWCFHLGNYWPFVDFLKWPFNGLLTLKKEMCHIWRKSLCLTPSCNLPKSQCHIFDLDSFLCPTSLPLWPVVGKWEQPMA